MNYIQEPTLGERIGTALLLACAALLFVCFVSGAVIWSEGGFDRDPIQDVYENSDFSAPAGYNPTF